MTESQYLSSTNPAIAMLPGLLKRTNYLHQVYVAVNDPGKENRRLFVRSVRLPRLTAVRLRAARKV